MLRYSSSTSSQYASSPTRVAAPKSSDRDSWTAQVRLGVGNESRDITPNAGYDEPLVTKLSTFVRFERDEVEMLEGFCRASREYEADHNLIQEGSSPGCIFVILSGLAYRFKLLPGGHRQILGYVVPGDICDLSFTIFDRADHNVSVLVPARIAKIPLRKFIQSIADSPNVVRALRLSSHLDTIIMREWLLNSGQSTAPQRLGHFLCEMASRLNKVGRINEDGWFDFPVNQVMLADTIGLTTVHINRTLQRLRRDGVILLDRRRLNIIDMKRLAEIANFEGNYLNAINLPG